MNQNLRNNMNWTKRQIPILAIVAASSFFGTFLISSVNIALPAIEKDFSLDAVTLSWVVTAFLLSTAMFLLPVGRWGDLTGIRRIFKAGMVIFTVSSLLSGFATTGYWLIVMRFLQGIGTAFSSTTGAAILVSAFLPQYRGRVLGISVSGVYHRLASGPFFITKYEYDYEFCSEKPDGTGLWIGFNHAGCGADYKHDYWHAVFAILFEKQAAETVANPLFLKALKFGFVTFATISLAEIYFYFSRGK